MNQQQQYQKDPYQPAYTETTYPQFAANAAVSERVGFIQRTYLHLMMAVFAFALIDFVMLSLFWDEIGWFTFNYLGGYGFLMVLGAFMVVSWIANSWAQSDTSKGMQYAGLSLYVVAEALIFLPLLFIAHSKAPGSISSAAIVTAIIFGGLTATVFVTKADFSFMRMFLMLGGFAAMALIVCSMVIGFHLGTIFSVAMVVLLSGYILYYTSNVLHHYRTDQHVAASLALFASVATLLWYVIQLFMSRD